MSTRTVINLFLLSVLVMLGLVYVIPIIDAKEEEYGVGIFIEETQGKHIIVVIAPGGPVNKDGHIKAGDEIIAIGKKSGGLIDVSDMSLTLVVSLLRGPKDTTSWFIAKREGHFFSTGRISRTFRIDQRSS